MVIRYPILCSTCRIAHTLRVGVGHSESQEHTFPCTECGEEITIRLIADYKNISTDIVCIENCVPSDSEGKIVNLHPEYSIPSDQVHKDRAFPWLGDMHEMANVDQIKYDQLGINTKIDYDELKRHHQMYGASSFLVEEWKDLKRSWSLKSNDRVEISTSIYHGNHNKYGYSKEIDSVEDWLIRFSGKVLSPHRLYLFENAAETKKHIQGKFSSQFSKFREYYVKNLFKDNFEKYFDLYSDYFKDYSEYSQVLSYVKREIDLPSGHQVSSRSFKRTKMFYGNAFEILTSNITVLACLNNILNGRAFDTFNQMDLEKYLTINKANRANTFKDTKEFYHFTKGLDSTLRNSSHHASMKYNKRKGIITYRSGGTGSVKTISYTDYLVKCNEAFISAVALLMLELIIVFYRDRDTHH